MEARRLNRAERVIELLEKHYPGWVEAVRLETVGGRCGWRTAVSIARKMLREREGRWDEADDPIPNRLQYRYVHAADCPSWQAWDVASSCKGCTMERITLSSYRIHKRGESAQTPKNENSLALDTGVEGSVHGDLRAHVEKAPHDCNEWTLR